MVGELLKQKRKPHSADSRILGKYVGNQMTQQNGQSKVHHANKETEPKFTTSSSINTTIKSNKNKDKQIKEEAVAMQQTISTK